MRVTAFIGDPTAGGAPDKAVPPLTGRLTEWFGGLQQEQLRVHSTFHINARSADGLTSLRVLDVSHTNTSSSNPFVPHSFEITTCGHDLRIGLPCCRAVAIWAARLGPT